MQTLHHPFCTYCTFTPVCSTEKKDSRWLKRQRLLSNRHRHLKNKEVLCLPKNKFQHLYVIQQGAIKTYQVEPDGKELIRGFYFSGEILGYEAIAIGHYLFSAVSLADTIVCEIPYDSFLELVQTKSTLQKLALHSMSQQLNVGSYLLSTTAEQRLAAFLLDLSVRLHPEETLNHFLLPMSRQDMGNYLRLTAETVSRILSRLQQHRLITIKHKKIVFLKRQQLQQIAEGLLSLEELN